jgi:hypothetical protein
MDMANGTMYPKAVSQIWGYKNGEKKYRAGSAYTVRIHCPYNEFAKVPPKYGSEVVSVRRVDFRCKGYIMVLYKTSLNFAKESREYENERY